jgi:membrane-associated phospholipid phosphatase
MTVHSTNTGRIGLILSLFLLAVAAISAAFLLDDSIQKLVLDANGGIWCRHPLVEALSRYGDWPELMLAGGIGFLIARRLRSVRWQRILLSAMIASTLSGMTVNASRLTTGRTRPRTLAEQGWYGPRHDSRWLIGEADFNSFPSGHTATAMGFAGVILFAAPPWGVPVLVIALAVTLSRILLGAHHLSDTVAASVVSFAIAWLVWEYLGRRGRVDSAIRKE